MAGPPNPTIAADAVGGSEVIDGSLTGADVSNDSLTGTDIDEGSLSTRTRARADDFGGCDPESSTFITCKEISLTVRRPAEVFLAVQARWSANAQGALGACHLTDGTLIEENHTMGETGFAESGTDAILAVEIATAGSHEYALKCQESLADWKILHLDFVAFVVGP